MEEEISSLYKVIDDANLTKMDLENQIESMKVELIDLARNHEEVSSAFPTAQCNSGRIGIVFQSLPVMQNEKGFALKAL